MKKSIFIAGLILSVVFISSSCGGHEEAEETTEQGATTKEEYTCSMHPEVKSDKPGDCSKCGMTLEKVEKKIITQW